MNDHRAMKTNSVEEGLSFGAGAISGATEIHRQKEKRRTIQIRLPRKPAAPRSSAVVTQNLRRHAQ